MKGEYEMRVAGTNEMFEAKVAGFPLRINEESLN
jgi:hypothetical protein